MGKLCILGGNSFIGKNLESDVKIMRADCDFLDFEKTKLTLKRIKPESIVNCVAKHGSVKEMSSNHVNYLEENLRINMNILRAAHELDINNVLLLGSISSFPFEKKSVISEEDFYLGPVNEVNFGYNAAKRMLVDLTKTYQIDYNRNYKVAHLGNIYGPHMRFSENATLVGNLIYRIYHAQIKNIDLVLYGDGADTRALTYVKDLQRILSWFMEDISLQSHIIVSSCQEVTIRELASQISHIMGFSRNIIFNGEGSLGQRKVAVSKVLNELLPSFEFTLLQEGLISTVEWFKQESSRPSSVGRASLS